MSSLQFLFSTMFIPLLSVCNSLFLVKRRIQFAGCQRLNFLFLAMHSGKFVTTLCGKDIRSSQSNTKYKSPASKKSPPKTLYAVAFNAETHRIVPCSLLETLHDVQSWAFCYALSSVLWDLKRPIEPSWASWCPRHFANRGNKLSC